MVSSSGPATLDVRVWRAAGTGIDRGCSLRQADHINVEGIVTALWACDPLAVRQANGMKKIGYSGHTEVKGNPDAYSFNPATQITDQFSGPIALTGTSSGRLMAKKSRSTRRNPENWQKLTVSIEADCQ
jgi:hypothetical protein